MTKIIKEYPDITTYSSNFEKIISKLKIVEINNNIFIIKNDNKSYLIKKTANGRNIIEQAIYEADLIYQYKNKLNNLLIDNIIFSYT